MSSSTYYFQHDYNARTNARIKRLLVKHGMLGYGVFWSIVEDLYNNENALPTDYDCIAFDLRVECNVVESVVKDFGLFTIENGVFTSKSVAKRLKERQDKSDKARESAAKRWKRKPDAMRSHNDGNANADQPQTDGNALKESKGKEIKGEGNNTPRFVNEEELKPFDPNEIPAAFDNPFQRSKLIHLDCVRLSRTEHEQLMREYGQQKTDWMINRLNNHKMSKAEYWYESDYHKIQGWVVAAATKDYTPSSTPVLPIRNMTLEEKDDLFGGRNPNYAG